MIYNMNTKALCLLLGFTAIYGAVEDGRVEDGANNSLAKKILDQYNAQGSKPASPPLHQITVQTTVQGNHPFGGRPDGVHVANGIRYEEVKKEPKFPVKNLWMSAGAVMTALSAGIVLDSFREAVNDVKYEHGDGTRFDSMCWVVLVLALSGASFLSMALFSGAGGNVGKVVGIICLFGAVATVTTAMAYMDTMAQGAKPLESTSAQLLYITGGLVVLALLCAAGRRCGEHGFFKDHGPVSVLGHGAGASLFIAGAGLFMWNMRERLGDVHEHHVIPDGSDKTVDFTGHGAGFILMTLCIGMGFLYFCYITFFRAGNKGTFGWKLLGSACVLGSGAMAIAAIDAMGHVTQTAAHSGATDMSLNDFVKQTTNNDARLFMIIGAGLFVGAILVRVFMKCFSKNPVRHEGQM